jgi:4-diphosphocytidyl-2-C-methyl-D-erythritol kinase
MTMLTVPAHAKINWSLRITGKRADGYHDLETLFQTISLHDTLTFTESDKLSLTCDDPIVPVDERNLVFRAARAVGAPPFAIALHKEIPSGGGLGGGSADAAATLNALGHPPLDEIALSLGSDVPFLLTGGTAYATGRGEILTPMPRLAGIPLLLLMPKERVSTARAFGRLQRFSPPLGVERYRTMIDHEFLSSPDLINDFEEPIFRMLPALQTLKTRLYEAGAAWAAMTGSGSTIVGAFRSAVERDATRERFEGVRVVAAETT